ncbi:MAG: 16S rRNA (cytosine(1402)-N(4))-methyltransferase RsmH [Rickettsiaceae bacterium]|nr:16S rRNA (cytosine(1402)-N(4))-methyltransferase RsmH [Rickettsiaceae bacterium]
MIKHLNHTPVMINEALDGLNITNGGLYVDCTFGAGGYTKAILEKAECKVIAIDQDPSTQHFAEEIEKFYPGRLYYINANFRNLKNTISSFGLVDGVVYDLGVSSMQLDDVLRGFSFQGNARLDMRMSGKGYDAYNFINESSEKELADIIYNYGGEHASRAVARKIIEQSKVAPIETTLELANIIRSVVKRKGRIDPATKTFQAIRIAVNDELAALEESLGNLEAVTKPSARVSIVSFHELEDSIVKKFFKNNSDEKKAISKYKINNLEYTQPFKIITNKTIKPSRNEVLNNPRSRSARLRIAERVSYCAK